MDPPKHRRLGTHEVRAIEHEHVEVSVGVERGAKALDQRDGAGRTRRAREPRCAGWRRRDGPRIPGPQPPAVPAPAARALQRHGQSR
jgi:hypothetical protein